jgi:hypothetical protein
MMINENTIIGATEDQVACDMKGELLILHTASGTYYGLDPVGTRVWSLLQEPKRVGAIRDILLDEYDVDRERCTRNLIELVEKLTSKKLVEVKSAPLA